MDQSEFVRQHREGLVSWLKAQDFNYAIHISPQLTQLDRMSAYRLGDEIVEALQVCCYGKNAVKAWCEESGTGTIYINPGSPWQNGIVESVNGRLRDERLSSAIVDTLAEARFLIDR